MSESQLKVHLRNNREVELSWSDGKGPEEVVQIIVQDGGFWLSGDRRFILLAAITQIDLVSGSLHRSSGFSAAYVVEDPVPAVGPIGIGNPDSRFAL